MKLSYFDLLSPDPVSIPNAGSIVSPRLRDISRIGYQTYQYYLSILLMDRQTYFSLLGKEEEYNALPETEKDQIILFERIVADRQSAALLENILNFFILEEVLYSPADHAFLVQENGSTIGIISSENYDQIADLIRQLNYIQPNPAIDPGRTKSKKAREIMRKLQKGRAEKNKQGKADKNMELGNIISAVANKSESLNILNIWDLTVFQIWDCFSRLSQNSIYAIQSMSVAAWGNKDHYFDAASWFQRIEHDN